MLVTSMHRVTVVNRSSIHIGHSSDSSDSGRSSNDSNSIVWYEVILVELVVVRGTRL